MEPRNCKFYDLWNTSVLYSNCETIDRIRKSCGGVKLVRISCIILTEHSGFGLRAPPGRKVRCSLFVVTHLNCQDSDNGTASTPSKIMNKKSEVAEMGDRVSTTDKGRKVGGAAVSVSVRGSWVAI